MQIKSIMRNHHYISVRMAKICKDPPNFGKDVKQLNFYALLQWVANVSNSF